MLPQLVLCLVFNCFINVPFDVWTTWAKVCTYSVLPIYIYINSTWRVDISDPPRASLPLALLSTRVKSWKQKCLFVFNLWMHVHMIMLVWWMARKDYSVFYYDVTTASTMTSLPPLLWRHIMESYVYTNLKLIWWKNWYGIDSDIAKL